MKKLCIVLSLVLIPVICMSQIIVTVAGSGEAGYKDKVKSLQAKLNYPSSLAVDDEGNIYIADSWNNRIRKVKKVKGDDLYEKATIVTIAGNGSHGYRGSNKPAKEVPLGTPKGVFPFKKGDKYIVYFSDSKNNIIRKVDKLGFIRDVAGNTKYGYQGENGPARKTSLAEPNGLFVDKNENVYICDTFNHRIRVVYNEGKVTGLKKKNPKKGYIYCIAGTGQSGAGGDGGPANKAFIGEPYDVWVDQKGNIFIAQKIGSIIRKIDAQTGNISTVAGVPNKFGYTGDERKATKEQLNQPFGVCVDLKGNIFIADGNNMRIRKVDTEGIIHTLTGRGVVGYAGDEAPAEEALISYPLDVWVDKSGNVFIADSSNAVIRMIKAEKSNK